MKFLKLGMAFATPMAIVCSLMGGCAAEPINHSLESSAALGGSQGGVPSLDPGTVLIGNLHSAESLPDGPGGVSPENVTLAGTGLIVGPRHILTTAAMFISRTSSELPIAIVKEGNGQREKIFRVRYYMPIVRVDTLTLGTVDDLAIAVLSDDANFEESATFGSRFSQIESGQRDCGYTVTAFANEDGKAVQKTVSMCRVSTDIWQGSKSTDRLSGATLRVEALVPAQPGEVEPYYAGTFEDGNGGVVRDIRGEVVGTIVQTPRNPDAPTEDRQIRDESGAVIDVIRSEEPVLEEGQLFFAPVTHHQEWIRQVSLRCLRAGPWTCERLIESDDALRICSGDDFLERDNWGEIPGGVCAPTCSYLALNYGGEVSKVSCVVKSVSGKIPNGEARGLVSSDGIQLAKGPDRNVDYNWSNLSILEGPTADCDICLVQHRVRTCAELADRHTSFSGKKTYGLCTKGYYDPKDHPEEGYGPALDLGRVFGESVADCDRCWGFVTE